MKKLTVLLIAILALSLISGCGGGGGGTKSFESTEQAAGEVVKVMVPNDLQVTEDLGSWAVAKEGEGWRFIVDVNPIKMISEDGTWESAVEFSKSFYDAKDYKFMGKDGLIYDAGAALAIVAPIDDKDAVTIRLKANVDDPAKETPEAREALLKNDYVKYMLENVKF